MNTLLSMGTKVVIFALIAYSIAIITEQRKHKISNFVLTFLSLGIFLDITATLFMILGTTNSIFTLHGILGYSSLLAMIIDTVLLWRFRLKNGADTEVPGSLHLYSRYAYIWWVLAFITGATLAMSKYV
ncbi:MAG: hypothetical protein H6627_07340 [Calditrichae bacterium]|nr:hypothetical protein [Calditrichota bacterium]MCB9058363.1 hypothetical protein [Calditrichia bacterium]